MISGWLGITIVVAFFALIIMIASIADYNDNRRGRRSTSDERKLVRWSLIVFFTSWLWPLWLLGLITKVFASAIKIAVKG